MKTLGNKWKQKSIENLEKEVWGQPPTNSTSLVEKVHRLRTIQIRKLEPKDIRLLIGHLIPVALDILQDDLFIDAESYEGDLRQNAINVDNRFWDDNNELKHKFNDLLQSYSDADKENFRKGKFEEWT